MKNKKQSQRKKSEFAGAKTDKSGGANDDNKKHHDPSEQRHLKQSLDFDLIDLEETKFNNASSSEILQDHKTAGKTYGSGEHILPKSSTPLEKYLRLAENDVIKQKVKIQKIRLEQEEIDRKLHEAKRSSSVERGTVCGNYHMRLGHSRRKCTLEKCTDVFVCGQENHIGQFNRKR